MIGLAIGKKAVLHGPEDGTTWGEGQLNMMFGDDLRFTSEFLHSWKRHVDTLLI